MNRYNKMFLSLLLASATILFICGITTGMAFAAFQDDADGPEMTDEEYEAYEAEYAAWEAADKEADILKSGAMLIEFMQKNPQSTLTPYADGSFKRLLAKCYEEKKYQELETLAEQWNTFKPGDENIVQMIAASARELKHTEKYLWALEEMYKTASEKDKMNFAEEFVRLYKDMKNDEKYVEWTETILKGSEGASDIVRHYELFQHFSAKNDAAKTLEYAQSTLKAIEQQKNPPADLAKLLPEIRYSLNHSIGVTHYTNKRYDDAMTYFLRALRDKKYSNGYFLIANCLRQKGMATNAILAYAKAQLLGESAQASADDKSLAPKAKAEMETIYKILQNNTTVGIERRYKTAQDMADEDLIKPRD